VIDWKDSSPKWPITCWWGRYTLLTHSFTTVLRLRVVLNHHDSRKATAAVAEIMYTSRWTKYLYGGPVYLTTLTTAVMLKATRHVRSVKCLAGSELKRMINKGHVATDLT